MKILGIDPGTATTGFGVIDVVGTKYYLLDHGLISTSKETPHGQRLDEIYQSVSQLLARHLPDQVAIERLFFATNALTAIAVGQAIGVIKLAIHHAGIPVFDYAPMQVKLLVGGSGKADKTLMKQTIKKMFKLREKKGDKTHFDNTADALAIAVCHARKTMLLLLVPLCLCAFVPTAKAIYNPLAVPNNRIGIHILDPQEIDQVPNLVNSTGGQWGYVTIPIRSNDRDKAKWQEFFLKCRSLHIIPILRLSTYPIGEVWEKPTSYDLVDFANFLVDMPWPTQNRYLILFNEPNHASEWGGEVNSQEYVNLLLDAQRIFKSASQDFFLLSAGLDMSVPNSQSSLDALVFYRQMFAYQPNWYDAIDGLSVHAYPNPGFIGSIYSRSRYGVTSFRYEQALLQSFGKLSKPIFITETGTKSFNYFFPAVLTEVWTDSNIVAITPFVFFAGTGEFANFSFLDTNHQPKAIYYHLQHFPKIAGSPMLSNLVSHQASPTASLPFPKETPYFLKENKFYSFLRQLIFGNFSNSKLTVGNAVLNVEIANTPAKREHGLSGRSHLDVDAGMLFNFPQAGIYPFWMKDMNFPLDFVWINSHRIVQLDANILPPGAFYDMPKIITPSQPIDQVLEISAGQIAALDLHIGDEIKQ